MLQRPVRSTRGICAWHVSSRLAPHILRRDDPLAQRQAHQLDVGADADGWVYVADRENHRVQVFDGNGKYEAQWNNMHRPCALYCCGGAKNPTFIIGELGPGMPVNTKHTNLGPRLSIVDSKGKTLARLGGEEGPGEQTGRFLSPHGLAVDSRGDIYVGEVSYTNWPSTFPGTPVPKQLRSLQKLEKVV